jgi:outer membrane biogenesis lipoprotein LolB|tara:strand:- start:2714 stop:2830 length:117 start_codon:yes stop_codon:yes gene_type:complete
MRILLIGAALFLLAACQTTTAEQDPDLMCCTWGNHQSR